jgi:hypothetical protein
MRSAIVIGLGLLVLCAGHSLSEQPAQPTKPTAPTPTGQAVAKWEYKTLNRRDIVQLGNNDLTTGLNKLGDEGWEMVACATLTGNVAANVEFYFKRSKGRTATEGGKTGGPPAVQTRNEEYQVIRVKFVSGADLAKTADAIFGGRNSGFRIVADPATNSVLAFGTPQMIEELRRLIITLDVPEAVSGSAEPTARTMVLPLKHSRATEMVVLLQSVYGKDPKLFRAGADERTNTLILYGPQKTVEELAVLLKNLDVPTPKDGGERKAEPILPPSRN